MHEYHIVERIVKEALADRSREEIAEILLSVNESSGLDPESIKLYFEDIRQAYPQLKEAKLSINLTRVKLHCPKCNSDFERKEKSFACPHCRAEAQRSPLNKDIFIEKIKY
ncbi:MAG: hydrogenase maturation nickel metallochaperone HypA [Candidatus Omnitrophica bacterium]|nr:hydrogenase maturation nickel metallochaperone HypA [Candidatus Omnitrophota bacterium]